MSETNPAEDPHLIERVARLAAFHDLPVPVVVQMVMMAAELKRRPVAAVHAEVEARIRQLKAGGAARPALRVVE
jgi:hypothetical protein